MRAQGLRFDRVLASPALLLDIIHEVGDPVERLLLVGHNPGLEQLALLLTDGEGLRREVAVKYPTATVAEIALPIDHWRDAAEGMGILARFIRPRDLDLSLGPDEDTH